MDNPQPRTDLPPQLDEQQVADLVEANPRWFAAAGRGGSVAFDPSEVGRGVDRPRVALLGNGESYTAWRADDRRGRSLVVRVPRRPVSELPRSLAEEADVLDRLPEGVGARRAAVHQPDAADPTAYLVTTLVPGEVLPPERWDDELLAALAGQLARLHVLGRTDGLTPPTAIDPVTEGETALAWWQDNEPEAATTLEPLWPAVRRHLEAARPAFDGLRPCLVHGDPALTNVLVADGLPRLVDWEWWHVGDAARDLAFAGGRVGAAPWYAVLADERVRRQGEAYARARAELGSPVDLEALLVRRAAHLVHETFFVSAHLTRVAAAGGAGELDAQHYAEAAAQLRDGLREWLG